MCGRFSLEADSATLAKRFKVNLPLPKWESSFNIAPGQNILAIASDEKKRVAEAFLWGFVPYWHKDPKKAKKLINARSETCSEKSSFRSSFKKKRCLIPADGFYEWKTVDKKKTPYLCTLTSGEIFSFAGLYDEIEYDGILHKTCLILTTDANSKLKKIHDRMPVILKEPQEDLWLDQDVMYQDQLSHLFKPIPSRDIHTSELKPEFFTS